MEKNNKGQNSEKIEEVIKLIIIGSVSVGKTSLLIRYATGKFQNVLKSTSTASYIPKTKMVNNKLYEIRLWDTAGQEKYRSLTKIFIKDAKIALLVYAIDDENSFKDLDMWLNIVKEVNNENIIFGIAANKADLYGKAKVSDEQGKQYAKKIDKNKINKNNYIICHNDNFEELVSKSTMNKSIPSIMISFFSKKSELYDSLIPIKKGDMLSNIL